MSNEERVLNVLQKVFPEANKDSNIDNLDGWDSLNHLRCLLGLEEEFKVMFSPEEMEKMTSVKEMISIISSKIPES
jgi:acyl carrier protein